MNIIFILIFILLLLLSYHKRSDLFSPLRVFLFNIFLFWGGAFYFEYNFSVNFYFLLILAFGFIIYYLEGKDNSSEYKLKFDINSASKRSIIIRLWLLTLIPVFAQILLIVKMGGIDMYVWSMNLRVKEWSGLGIYIILIRSILIINLI